MVKTDTLSTKHPSRTVSIPYDDEKLCTRETCLPKSLEMITLFCTPLAQKPEVKLRFSCGDSVGFRVGDHDDGSDQWFNGVVRERLGQNCQALALLRRYSSHNSLLIVWKLILPMHLKNQSFIVTGTITHSSGSRRTFHKFGLVVSQSVWRSAG